MELKTDALLLRAVDFGENDKMVTLLTADRGKLGAGMKGVKKANARLRFAAQPFCFAEYVLAEKSGRHTVISASLYDGFFPLREDVGKYFAAAVVCEACDKLAYEGMPCGELLVAAVSALKNMCGEDAAFPLIKFLLTALRLSGYPVRAGLPATDAGAFAPTKEGGPSAGALFFEMESGSFSAEKGTPASPVTYFTVREALGLKAPPRTRDGEKRALRLLYSYFAYQTDSELTSLPEFVRML